MPGNANMRSIRPGLQAALSYTVLIVCVIGFLNIVVWPAVNARKQYLEQIATQQTQNSRFIQAIDDYQQRIANNPPSDEEDDIDSHARFLHADTLPLAGARLQDQLRTMISDAGAELISASFRRGDDTLTFPPVTVNIRLRSSVETLQELLFAIETETTELFVENLYIESRHREGRIIQNTRDELEVRLDVTGYFDREGS